MSFRHGTREKYSHGSRDRDLGRHLRACRMRAFAHEESVPMQKVVTSPPAASRPLWMVILAAGVIVGIAMGLRQVMGLYLTPMTKELGIGREPFSTSANGSSGETPANSRRSRTFSNPATPIYTARVCFSWGMTRYGTLA